MDLREALTHGSWHVGEGEGLAHLGFFVGHRQGTEKLLLGLGSHAGVAMWPISDHDLPGYRAPNSNNDMVVHVGLTLCTQ